MLFPVFTLPRYCGIWFKHRKLLSQAAWFCGSTRLDIHHSILLISIKNERSDFYDQLNNIPGLNSLYQGLDISVFIQDFTSIPLVFNLEWTWKFPPPEIMFKLSIDTMVDKKMHHSINFFIFVTDMISELRSLLAWSYWGPYSGAGPVPWH